MIDHMSEETRLLYDLVMLEETKAHRIFMRQPAQKGEDEAIEAARTTFRRVVRENRHEQ